MYKLICSFLKRTDLCYDTAKIAMFFEKNSLNIGGVIRKFSLLIAKYKLTSDECSEILPDSDDNPLVFLYSMIDDLKEMGNNSNANFGLI
jgi:hypothetical protein